MARYAIETKLCERVEPQSDKVKARLDAFVAEQRRKAEGTWRFNENAGKIDVGKSLSNALEAQMGYRVLGQEKEEAVLQEEGEAMVRVLRQHGWSGVPRHWQEKQP